MAICNCGAKLEYGHVEVSAGENADTLDVWYEKCAGIDGFWCGYYRVFDNPPNTACSGLAASGATVGEGNVAASH